MRMSELRKRNYIYCPICAARIEPLIHGGTDDTMNGVWTCDECRGVSSIHFELLESEDDCAYPQYKDLSYSSWYCERAEGVVSQDLCQRICKFCKEDDD